MVRLGAIRRRRISFGRASSLSHLKRLARGHLPELQPLQLCLDPLPSLAHRDPVVAVRDPVRLAQVYVGALVIEGGRKRGGAKGPEAPVQRKDVAKVGKPVAKDLGRNGLAVKALVLLGLLLRPAHLSVGKVGGGGGADNASSSLRADLGRDRECVEGAKRTICLPSGSFPGTAIPQCLLTVKMRRLDCGSIILVSSGFSTARIAPSLQQTPTQGTPLSVAFPAYST